MKTMIAMMVLMVGLNAVPASAESTDAFSNDVEDSINKANAISAEVMAKTKLSLGLIALGFDKARDTAYFSMSFNKSGGDSCGEIFGINVYNNRLSVNDNTLLSANSATDFLLKTQNLELIKTQLSEVKKAGLLQIQSAHRLCKEDIERMAANSERYRKAREANAADEKREKDSSDRVKYILESQEYDRKRGCGTNRPTAGDCPGAF